MANFKNKKPKKARGHCHMCKAHKDMGNSKSAWHINKLRYYDVLVK